MLVADDDELVRRTTAQALAQAGYQVHEAADGYGAVSALKSGGIDVVLADINMPGNENLEFVREEATAQALVPVILMTGYPSMQSAIDALRLGVVDYITKPIRLEELFQRVEAAIEKGRALRALRDAEDRIASLSRWLDGLKASLSGATSSLPPPSGARSRSDAAPSDRSELSGLTDDEYARLSPREREVVRSLALGHHVQDMARLLDVSTNTVRNHLKSVFLKLGVNSQIQLLAKVSGRRADR